MKSDGLDGRLVDVGVVLAVLLVVLVLVVIEGGW
jgi:hypothetical protein